MRVDSRVGYWADYSAESLAAAKTMGLMMGLVLIVCTLPCRCLKKERRVMNVSSLHKEKFRHKTNSFHCNLHRTQQEGHSQK